MITDERLASLAAAYRMHVNHRMALEVPPSLEEISWLAQFVINLRRESVKREEDRRHDGEEKEI